MAEQACVAIIAINARERCKTRLDRLLGADGRVALARAMLDRVLAAARAAPGLDALLVVSPERDRVPDDVPVLHDDGDDLNAAMETGRREAVARGARELLVLPADLPLLGPTDLGRLLAAGRRCGVAIATDRRGVGTNGLYLPADVPFRFHFGPESCERHETEARRLGLGVRRVRSPGLLADLDTAEDLPGILGRPRPHGWPPLAVAAS